MSAGDRLTIDASADSFAYRFNGGAEDDHFVGGQAQDFIDVGSGHNVANGGGNDTLVIDGYGYDGGLVFTALTVRNIETIQLGDADGNGAGGLFGFVTDDATVAAGRTLTLDARFLVQSGSVTFDGSAETDGHFILLGGNGDNGDRLTGGALGDTIRGNDGD